MSAKTLLADIPKSSFRIQIKRRSQEAKDLGDQGSPSLISSRLSGRINRIFRQEKAKPNNPTPKSTIDVGSGTELISIALAVRAKARFSNWPLFTLKR
jgi:hypothetical protein